MVGPRYVAVKKKTGQKLDFKIEIFVVCNVLFSRFLDSDSPMPVTSRVCFVKFQEPESVGVSQHLTNTVFVDRALIVVPFAEGLSLRYSLFV